MSRTTRALATLVIAGRIAAGMGPVEAMHPTQGRALASVRQATARYHHPAAALADGYVATEHCIENPELGGMGLHYVNPALLVAPALDPTKPEVLLYESLPGGKLRLAAVEWFAVDPDQDVTTDDGRPSLFGVPFDGPMLGHEPEMPVHFDLHAWIWKYNPAGTFSAWNPEAACTNSPPAATDTELSFHQKGDEANGAAT